MINGDEKVGENVTQTNEGKSKIKTQKNSREKVDGKNQKNVRLKSLEDTAYPF
ncbi:hypothetical protein [Bacillus cereus]|uniref:hypothetical protein n=1 Tax=Bacillus cereus TaxID=1396 RepID=UPI0015D51E4C|nr:hypothetical protein [Bacillus cereus]